MKNKLWNLYKTTLFNNYNKKSGSKIGGTMSGLTSTIVIYCILLAFSLLYSFIGFKTLEEKGLQNYLPLIFYAITLIVTFTLTINKAKSTIFDSKYNDLLFSMPFKPKTILASRILTLLTMNYLTTLVIMVPSLAVFGILSKMTVLYYIISFFIIIFTPFLPVTLAALVGYFIAFLSSNVKVGKKVFEIIFTFLFFGIFMICYSFSSKFFEIFASNIEKVDLFVNKYGFILKYMSEALINQNFVSLMKFVLINLGLLIVLVWGLSLGFFKITSRLNENSIGRGNNKKNNYTRKSAVKTLTLKELKNMFGIPTYIFNSLFGVVILFIASIATFFISKENIFNMIKIGEIDVNAYIPIYLLSAIIFIVGMSNTTCSSISLEGKNFWITKSLPIKTKNILDSKILTNIITVSIPTTIAIIIACFNFKIGIVTMIGILLISLVLNIMVAEFGLLINLAFPKLNYESEIQVVKQSTSTFISVFSMMIFAILVIVAVFITAFLLGINITMIGVIILFLTIAFVERLIINNYGIKKIQKLSN